MAKQQFRLYNVTVQLGGSAMHAVPKTKITAPEIALLAMVHGPDAIIPRSIVHLKDQYESIDSFELRAQLIERYKTANINGEAMLQALFGALGPLPTRIEEVLPGLETHVSDEMDDESAEALASLARTSVHIDDHEAGGSADALREALEG